MNQDTIKVLLIEDNPGDARLIQEFLKDSPGKNFDIHLSTTLSEGLQILSSEKFDVVLSDLGLSDSQG
ncbi:MAG: guanylate cyclase, partial [Bacteroidia bacterium]|nr:guanylate cyclase [Bacteroidia bacterium]